VLSQRDGTGDQQVGMFQQHHQVMPLGSLRLALGADRSDCLPARFHGSADAVLVVPRQAMPQRRARARAKVGGVAVL